jgi:hypothetical protein
MASEIDDILARIGASESKGPVSPLQITGEGEELEKPAKEEPIKTEKLEINPEDVKNFLEYLNNFLGKRPELKKWELDPIETKNATTLLVRLGEKYGIWLLNYALEIEAGVFVLFYIMARMEIEKNDEIIPFPSPDLLKED